MKKTEKCWLCEGKGITKVICHAVTLDSKGNEQVHEWVEDRACRACGGTGKDLPFAPNISLVEGVK